MLLVSGTALWLVNQRRAVLPRLQAAIVYVCEIDRRSVVAHLTASGSHPQLLRDYPLQRDLFGAREGVPDVVGILPSPDGSWLLAWGPVPAESTPLGRRRGLSTEWIAICLRDGSVVKLTEAEDDWRVSRSLLPYWAGETRLVLEGSDGAWVFDLEGGAEPGVVAATEQVVSAEQRGGTGAERLVKYLVRHYAEEREAYLAAVERLRGPLGMEGSRQWKRRWPLWREEWPYLLTLGIPVGLALREPTAGWMTGWPRVEISCSPDERWVARADQGISRRLKRRDPPGRALVRGARLDVLEVSSGRRIWGTQALPTPTGYIPGHLRIGGFPPPALWNSPQFWDVRWSRDGRYLSFTLYDAPGPSVIVMDAKTWKEVLRIPNAMDAFVLPEPKEEG